MAVSIYIFEPDDRLTGISLKPLGNYAHYMRRMLAKHQQFLQYPHLIATHVKLKFEPYDFRRPGNFCKPSDCHNSKNSLGESIGLVL